MLYNLNYRTEKIWEKYQLSKKLYFYFSNLDDLTKNEIFLLFWSKMQVYTVSTLFMNIIYSRQKGYYIHHLFWLLLFYFWHMNNGLDKEWIMNLVNTLDSSIKIHCHNENMHKLCFNNIHQGINFQLLFLFSYTWQSILLFLTR